MDKVLQFLENELARARIIFEPLEQRLEIEDEYSYELDPEEQSDLDYYMGYADGLAAGIVAIRHIQDGKELPLGIAGKEK